jgi:hypothetical protein
MAIWRKSPSHAAIAVLLIAALSFGSGMTVPQAAENHGAIKGTLYQADAKTELAGAKVTVVNVKTGEKFTSNVTGENGNYEVRDLPAGSYDVVIEIDGTVFVADNLVDLSHNDTMSLDYNVTPQRPANRVVKGVPKPQGAAQEAGGSSAPAGYHGFWGSAGGIALIVVLVAGAGVAIANSGNDSNASPSAP